MVANSTFESLSVDRVTRVNKYTYAPTLCAPTNNKYVKKMRYDLYTV